MSTVPRPLEVTGVVQIGPLVGSGNTVSFACDTGVSPLGADPKFHALSSRPTHAASARRKVRRRLNGFLIEMRGQEAKVAFVRDDEEIIYYLPSVYLRKAGIERQNQPFEMDEVELQSENGFAVQYEFRPLARTSDAFEDSVELDEESKRKRDLILRAFKRAAD